MCNANKGNIRQIHNTQPKNAQCSSLDVYIISHYILLRVSTHKVSSSGNQTTTILHKTKLATFIHSLHGVKGSDS